MKSEPRRRRYFGSPHITPLLLVGAVLSVVAVASGYKSFRLPGNQQGYAPTQPIAFSHRLHTGELAIDCLYCHYGAETSRHAGIPAASVCLNCHGFVMATLGALRAEDELAAEEDRSPLPIVSEELQKLYDALALDAEMEPVEGRNPTPIEWVKVHNLPDFVYFDHRAHVSVGLDCQRCHGTTETMEVVNQVESLSMGWCVNCHRLENEMAAPGREINASLDCVTCHY